MDTYYSQSIAVRVILNIVAGVSIPEVGHDEERFIIPLICSKKICDGYRGVRELAVNLQSKTYHLTQYMSMPER
jgi:hypothetical protein